MPSRWFERLLGPAEVEANQGPNELGAAAASVLPSISRYGC
jgi:hypothetical protein